MKRTAAVGALALMSLAGFAGSALADKGGDPGPPSQPPGHSGSAPGQEKKAEQPAPAVTTPAATAGQPATPAPQGQRPKPKPAKPKPKPAKPKPKPAKPKPKPATPSSHASAGKITICHRTGSEKNPWVQITVSANAWQAHQKHGDLNPVPSGGCPGGGPSGGGGGGGGEDHRKITICHKTGSENNPWVEITVSENAWQAHQKHGDLNPVPAGGCPTGPAAMTSTTTTRTSSQAPTPATTTATTPLVAASAATSPSAVPSQAAPAAPATAPAGAPPAAAAPIAPKEAVSRQAQPAAPKAKVAAKGKRPEQDVLERARNLGRVVQRQTLPFTGLPLWIVLLAGVGLTAAGFGLRKWARPAKAI